MEFLNRFLTLAWHMRTRVAVVCLSVCMSICMHVITLAPAYIGKGRQTNLAGQYLNFNELQIQHACNESNLPEKSPLNAGFQLAAGFHYKKLSFPSYSLFFIFTCSRRPLICMVNSAPSILLFYFFPPLANSTTTPQNVGSSEL